MQNQNVITVENNQFRLILSKDCKAKSLIFKPTGEECLDTIASLPFFSLTEERAFNNEIKLAHPLKKITLNANKVRREGNTLIVGFELVTFEAIVEIGEKSDYITFTLKDFILYPKSFGRLAMTPPPVSEFRLIQLPIKERENFGEWLNVAHGGGISIGVIATSPTARINAHKDRLSRIMTADALRGIELRGCTAAMIVSKTEDFLNCVEQIEIDFDLPRGVQSRKQDFMSASVYFLPEVSLKTVDKHIARAKKGGFSMMLLTHRAIFKVLRSYHLCGDYDFNDEYPGGFEDLKKLLQKIKDAGITPGFHFLHTHIGIQSRYVTPVLDHRLNLTRHFTLAKPLGEKDDIVYVEENPVDCPMHKDTRVLKFDGEAIYYEEFSTEYPYCFKGCKRGHFNTNVTPHALGTIGGILDISEFSATSIYLNQNSSLQDEIADKLAAIYDCGFEFVYFDGSEGTNPPFEYHVANAQYRVYKKLGKKPLFCEGAAKSHFSWHMLSGGNAFDAFPNDIFKAMIAEHPLKEAPRMANDFTRVDFGWWNYWADTQPDLYEYGTSKAAAWDCPITFRAYGEEQFNNPRNDDVFEVLRRWEDVRRKKWLTPAMKEMLKDPVKEYTLLINEQGEYELCEYTEIKLPEALSGNVAAFIFERQNKNYIVCWHKTGEGKLILPTEFSDAVYEKELGGKKLFLQTENNTTVFDLAGCAYFSTDASKNTLIEAFQKATFA